MTAGGQPTVESTLDGMLQVFDVRPDGEGRYAGTSDGGARRVVDGSQLLGQAIVAASKELPDHTVRSAHAVFTRAADDERALWFEVDVTHRGRTVAGALVAVGQGDRRCATVSLLLDTPTADVVRRAAPMPAVGGPADALPFDMPLPGRELRLVDLADPNDPDEVGPPVLDAWLHYDRVPDRPDLARALVAHFTGHLSVSTTFRAHPGVGTAQAHRTLSTAVMTITVAFHDPVTWDGWLLYHHESVQVGGGMSLVRGQIFTEQGTLVASFSQEALIRPFESGSATLTLPVEARL
jgi:acyl-CoA thioesterase II